MSGLGGDMVLVTGGAGFIGSHTVDRLMGDGYVVAVIDNLSSGRMKNLANHACNERFFFMEADIADGLFVPLAPVLKAAGSIDAIVHLAAQTSVQRSVNCPLNDARVNHFGTLQVFEFARLHGVKKVVFISSAAIYGDAAPVPTTEEAPETPISPYGVHKLAGEYIMKYYAHVHGILGVGLRLFNVYGSRQDSRSPYSGVISLFCSQSIANDPMTIYGDGRQTRDFVHVSDVVNAIIAAIRCDAEADGVFNIGSGNACTIRDVAEIIRSACDSRSEIRRAPARAGDIRHSCADVSAAGAALHFQPKVGIQAGLADTVAWFAAEVASSRGGHRRSYPRGVGVGTSAEPERPAAPA